MCHISAKVQYLKLCSPYQENEDFAGTFVAMHCNVIKEKGHTKRCLDGLHRHLSMKIILTGDFLGYL